MGLIETLQSWFGKPSRTSRRRKRRSTDRSVYDPVARRSPQMTNAASDSATATSSSTTSTAAHELDRSTESVRAEAQARGASLNGDSRSGQSRTGDTTSGRPRGQRSKNGRAQNGDLRSTATPDTNPAASMSTYSNGFAWTSAEAAAAQSVRVDRPTPDVTTEPASSKIETVPRKDETVTEQPGSDGPPVQVLMEGGLADLKRISKHLSSVGVESQIVMPPGGCNT